MIGGKADAKDDNMLQCPCCYGSFTEKDCEPYLCVPCCHTFCKSCAERMHSKEGSCGVCRASLSKNVKPKRNTVLADLLGH